MKDERKTKQQLIAELRELRRRQCLKQNATDAALNIDACLRSVLESMPDAVVLMDQAAQVIFWNEGAQSMFGFSPSEILGKSGTLLIAESRRAAMQDALKSLTPENPDLPLSMIIESFFVKKNKTIFPGEISMSNRVISGRIFHMGIIRDITQRKRTETALKESEERLRTAGRAAYDLIYEWDVSRDRVEWFGPVDEALGYRPGKGPASTRDWVKAVHPDDLETLKSAFDRYQTRTDLIRYECRVRHCDGSWRHWSGSALPMLDERGLPARWIGVCTDITDTRQVGLALERSERLYRTLVESMSDSLVTADADGIITYANPKFCSSTGFHRQDLIGRNFTELLDKTNRHKWRRHQNKRRQGIASIYELELKTQSGRRLVGLASGSPLMNEQGEFMGSISILTDITLRKQAEIALKEAHEELNRVLASVSDYLWSADVDQNARVTYRYISPVVETLTGRPAAYFMPGPERWLSIVHPDDRDRVLGKIVECVSIDDGIVADEFRIVRTDGSVCWVRDSVSVRKISPGSTRLDGVITDITEQKWVETEKTNLEAQLNRAEKMETIGVLAGGVAHDLNNILGPLVGYPDLVLRDLKEESPLREAMLAIKDSGKRAAMVVQDLLTLGRRGANASEVLNLNDIVRWQLQSREFNSLKEMHPDVHIDISLADNLSNVIGSSVQLAKAAMNLLINAAEAMPADGSVSVITENIFLEQPVQGYDRIERGRYVVVTVADNGPGIDRQDLKSIFEPFYTKKVMGRSGTGLGLSVVWGTVKDHRGYIDVESRVGEGTTFRIFLPATEEKRSTPEQAEAIESYMGNGETIAVVDDILSQRELAAAMLKTLKYNPITFGSGEEALGYLKHHSADLLVLDMIMGPGMDGLETYKRVLKIHPVQKAVITSGYTETDQVREALCLGAGTYIKKPYPLEKIARVVKEELGRTAEG